jgi:hypothetical protein
MAAVAMVVGRVLATVVDGVFAWGLCSGSRAAYLGVAVEVAVGAVVAHTERALSSVGERT